MLQEQYFLLKISIFHWYDDRFWKFWHKDTNTKCPPNISPPEYKPPKMCLKMAISPGLIFGILRYLQYTSISRENFSYLYRWRRQIIVKHWETLSSWFRFEVWERLCVWYGSNQLKCLMHPNITSLAWFLCFSRNIS